VQRILTQPGDRVAFGLCARYPHVRRFLPDLLRLVTFDATAPNDPVLAATTHLRAVDTGTMSLSPAPTEHVTNTGGHTSSATTAASTPPPTPCRRWMRYGWPSNAATLRARRAALGRPTASAAGQDDLEANRLQLRRALDLDGGAKPAPGPARRRT
jgi:hypothetical protein